MVELFEEPIRRLGENHPVPAGIISGLIKSLEVAKLIPKSLEDDNQTDKPGLVWEKDPKTRERFYKHKKGNFSFFPERGTIIFKTDDGEKMIPLGSSENKTLILLTENINKVVPYSDFGELSPDRNNHGNSPSVDKRLAVCINRLRNKIDPETKGDRSRETSSIIRSYRSFGYELVDLKNKEDMRVAK